MKSETSKKESEKNYTRNIIFGTILCHNLSHGEL